jgi:hypothetical protein
VIGCENRSRGVARGTDGTPWVNRLTAAIRDPADIKRGVARLGDKRMAACSVVAGRHLVRLVLPWQALGREGPPVAALLLKAKQQGRNCRQVRGIVVAPVNLVAAAESPRGCSRTHQDGE